jgi:hypothetical protein
MRRLVASLVAAAWVAAAGPAHAATEWTCAEKMTETLALEKNLRGPGARKKFKTYVERAKASQARRDWDGCVKALETAVEKGPPPKR